MAVSGYRVPPDGCLDIVYDREHGLRAVGAITVEQRFDFPERARVAGVRLRPGMAEPLLGISPAELTDGSAPLEQVWSRGVRELERQLDDAQSIQEAMRVLLGSLRAPAARPNPVQQAIEAVAAANGAADLEGVASQAGLILRQFRRRCQEESGLTPKHLCRVLRFRHACHLARKCERPNWAAIAAEARYFDQAHFIRDFREFTGGTPVAVFPIPRPRLPARIEA